MKERNEEKNLSEELTIIPDQRVVAVGNKIDLIVNECLPVAAQESQNFVQALTLANGIKELRQIFLRDENIKDTVKSMQNTHLGFMTDRTDLAIWKSQQKGSNKEIKPYRYEDVAEVCIEAMFKGYRITNNEFNMIAGRFYAAKNGKFRRINEMEDVTDFHFTTTTPLYEKEQGGIQYAKVQAFASWKRDGQLATLGASTTKSEDKLVFKIRVNKFMGEDAIVGKALSKLFTRVLMRLEGKIMPESTDVSDEDVVDAEFKTSDLSDKIKKAQKADQKPENQSTDEKPKPISAEPGKEKRTLQEEVEENQEEPELQKTEEIKTESSGNIQEAANNDFRDEWIKIRSANFSTFVHKNRSKFLAASPELQEEARIKWEKFYPGIFWPIEPKPKDDEKSKMISAIQTFFSEEAIKRALSYQHQTDLDDCTFETLEMIHGYLQKSEKEDDLM